MLSLKKYMAIAALLIRSALLLSACGSEAEPTGATLRTYEDQTNQTPTPTLPEHTPGATTTQAAVTTAAETEPRTTAAPTTEAPLADYEFNPEYTGIYLTRSGKIKSAEITDFDNTGLTPARYTEAGLKSFVNGRVTAYNTEKGGEPIKVELLQVRNKVAKLILSYASIEDFMAFQGSDFSVNFLALLDRESAIRGYDIRNLKDTSGNPMDLLSALRSADSKIVVVNGRIHITLNGNITAVSDNLIVTGNNAVRCDSDQGYSFIIFR